MRARGWRRRARRAGLLAWTAGSLAGCTNVLEFDSRPEPMGATGTWELTLRQECNGAGLGDPWRTAWLTGDSPHRVMNHTQDYAADENITLDNGECRITATDTPQGERPYTSGTLNTAGSFEQRYGFFEAKLRIPSGQGLWPVWWLRHVDGWPPAIDIFSAFGQEPRQANMSQWWLDESAATRGSSAAWEGPDFSADFHVFGLRWTPDELIWYVDGVERRRSSEGSDAFAEPLYPTVNLFVGRLDEEPEPVTPDATTPWPARLRIDWVRVYRRADPSNPSN